MSGPVDVLAVLQYHAIGLRDAPWLTRKQAGKVADELAKASAAVAELIEALRNIVASLAEHDDEGMIEHAEQMIAARAALAKATGGVK